MKSLEALFQKERSKQPLCSTLICFNMAVTKQGFAQTVIRKHFKLVDKTDYLPSMKIKLIQQAYKLTSI